MDVHPLRALLVGLAEAGKEGFKHGALPWLPVSSNGSQTQQHLSPKSWREKCVPIRRFAGVVSVLSVCSFFWSSGLAVIPISLRGKGKGERGKRYFSWFGMLLNSAQRVGSQFIAISSIERYWFLDHYWLHLTISFYQHNFPLHPVLSMDGCPLFSASIRSNPIQFNTFHL